MHHRIARRREAVLETHEQLVADMVDAAETERRRWGIDLSPMDAQPNRRNPWIALAIIAGFLFGITVGALAFLR